MTIDELKQYCSGEFANIERVREELFSVYSPDKAEYPLSEKASIAALVVNIYGGIENVLKQMLIFDKLDVQDAPEWHEKVLRKSGEIGILPPDLVQVLSRYLAFRNYFLYTYIFNINWEDVKALVDALNELIGQIRSEVDEYLQTI
ncbi:MAG: hypothetical protein AMK71_11290 [Nitrospira bacterium SG8_35_4]|nr:MAG: hypothetical protein AMK71_11290 [Nitrospira bacterium SG8_35_4]